jgi:hypothetical protein
LNVRSIFLIAILVCAAAPAMAQSACTEPVAPAPVDGAAVSQDQLRAAVTVAKDFIAQSDVYQSCLLSAFDAAKAQAATDSKPVDPALAGSTQTKVAANQKTKEKVGTDINAAIGVYKKTHDR